jgi:hypothetical protein
MQTTFPSWRLSRTLQYWAQPIFDCHFYRSPLSRMNLLSVILCQFSTWMLWWTIYGWGFGPWSLVSSFAFRKKKRDLLHANARFMHLLLPDLYFQSIKSSPCKPADAGWFMQDHLVFLRICSLFQLGAAHRLVVWARECVIGGCLQTWKWTLSYAPTAGLVT